MSHVIPAFVFRWLRQRSGTGHIRFTETPNRRVQDGDKKRWLCTVCEGVFSRHERSFSSKMFHPWLNGNQRIFYDDWLMRFCVSISWRVLSHLKGQNPDATYTPEQDKIILEAKETWRKFLLGEVSSPGKFEQHLVITDLIESTTVPGVPPNINRYLTGSVEMDIVGSSKTLFTFAKLGRFIIFGKIQGDKRDFEGTKVHLKKGLVTTGTVGLQMGLLEYFIERAKKVNAAHRNMSQNQADLIDKSIRENIDLFVVSEQFSAMKADVEMFGPSAIIRKPRGRKT